MPRDPFHRFMDKVDVNVSGCWNWQGTTAGTNARYGYFQAATKQSINKIPAHRFMYEYVKGAIPEGLEIDHLCKNKLCVNPSHLEAVSHRENSNRVKWNAEKMQRPNTARDNRGRYVRTGD